MVQTVGDIRRYVADLDPARSPPRDTVKLSTRMDVNDGTKTQTYAVSAVTHSKSKRDQLLEGMTVIKQMMDAPKQQPEPVEINGRVVEPPALGDSFSAHNRIDPLIKQWLGGSREGVTIYWDLDDGYRYKYCIFSHKLTRVPRVEASQPPAAGPVPPAS